MAMKTKKKGGKAFPSKLGNAAKQENVASTLRAVSNPFEARTNKRMRFNILGRKVKGAERNVALARSSAVERRNNTLLVELRESQKHNSFVDRRFGEKDDTLDPETKNLVRFQKERLRQLKVGKRGRKFNLEGEADSGGKSGGSALDVLTHGGRTLSDMDAFEQPRDGRAFDDDDDKEADAADPLSDVGLRFGGGDFDGDGGGAEGVPWRGKAPVPAWKAAQDAGIDRKRSYKEIMEEVIGKSKAARAERTRDKEEQEAFLTRLDAQHGKVIRLLGKGSMVKDDDDEEGGVDLDGYIAEAVQSSSAVTGRAITLAPSQPTRPSAPAVDMAYGALVRELARHSRAAIARDRTKTEEEVASEEAARLRELEGLRRQRARAEQVGAVGASGDDLGDNTGFVGAKGGSRTEAEDGDDLTPWDVTGGLTARQSRAQRSAVSLADHVEEVAQAQAAKKKKQQEEDGEDEEEDSDDDDDGEEEEDSDEEEDEEAMDEDDEGEGEREDIEGDEEEEDDNEDEDDGVIVAPRQLPDSEDKGAQAAKRSKGAAGAPISASTTANTSGGSGGTGAVPELPFTPAVPEDWTAFDRMLRTYVCPLANPCPPPLHAGKRKRPDTVPAAARAPDPAAAAVAADELLRRMRALHATALGAANVKHLSRLYDLCVEDVLHMGMTVGRTAGDGEADGEQQDAEREFSGLPLPLWRVQTLAAHVFSMSQEGALRRLAAPGWRERVGAFNARVQSALAAGPMPGAQPRRIAHSVGAGRAPPLTGPSTAAWPSGADLLLLSLCRHLFPVSDFRHPIVVPACLTAAQCLNQTPVMNVTDIARGALTAAALADLILPARRYQPELCSWLWSVLALFAGVGCKGVDEGEGVEVQAVQLRVPALQPTFRPFARVTAPHDCIRAALAYELSQSSSTASASHGVPFSIAGLKPGEAASSSSPAADRLVSGILHATLTTVRALASSLVPEPFLGAPRARRAVLMQAALAPAGDAAQAVRAGGGGVGMSSSGGTGSVGIALPLQAHADCPVLATPEMLDPLIGACTLIVSHIQAAQGRGKATGTGGAGAVPAMHRLPLVLALTSTLAALLRARDGVAELRGHLRLHDNARPAAAVRSLAPLMEDVNSPFGSATGEATYRQLSAAGVSDKKASKAAKASEDARTAEEVRKLQRTLKREKRGAVRELRKDRQAIVRATDATRAVRDGEREGRYKELLRELEAQAHNANLLSGKRKPKPVPGGTGKTDKTTLADKMPWLLSTGKKKADRRARKEGHGAGPAAPPGKSSTGGKYGKSR